MGHSKEEFNSARLQGLASHPSGDGRTLLDVLVEDFLASAPTQISEMEFQAERRNYKGIAEAAEALRSPAMNLGLVKLASICADLEAANAFTPDVAKQVATVQTAFDRAVAWLKNPGVSQAG